MLHVISTANCTSSKTTACCCVGQTRETLELGRPQTGKSEVGVKTATIIYNQVTLAVVRSQPFRLYLSQIQPWCAYTCEVYTSIS